MTYDIIGDIHGYADRLEALLTKLGYQQRAGAWRHPSSTAIFVGDLIDRGPHQLRTLELVRSMQEAGSANVIMGNHELNAIAWATPDPKSNGRFLRPRDGTKGKKNLHQHEAFLAAVGLDSEQHHSWINWFYQLPLWIDQTDFRVVHACWAPEQVSAIGPYLREGNLVSPELIEVAHCKGTKKWLAVEILLKGVEVRLPEGQKFRDKDGVERNAIRTRWWKPELDTYKTAYIGPPIGELPELPLKDKPSIPLADKPTFIGHYWFDPNHRPEPASSNVACVDYSAGRGGPLVAYRFDGDPKLSADNFVSA